MVLAAEKPPKRAAPPKPDQGQDKPPKEAQSPSSPPDPPAAEFPPPDPPFSPGDKQYATFEESVKALKDTEKDCSCTPDIFLATIAEFVKRFLGEIDWYMGEYYAPVFLSLSPVQLRYLRQQMDQICNAAEQLYQSVKGAHEHE